MKKVILVYIVLIAAFVLLAVFGFGQNLPFIPNFGGDSNPTATATIGEQQIDLLVADNDEERIKGLSERESLPENQGMLFIFEEKAIYAFWMKGMQFPIDIIFIDDNNVVDVYSNAQPPKDVDENPERYSSTEPVNHVLELNAGKAEEFGITEGSTITFEGL